LGSEKNPAISNHRWHGAEDPENFMGIIYDINLWQVSSPEFLSTNTMKAVLNHLYD